MNKHMIVGAAIATMLCAGCGKDSNDCYSAAYVSTTGEGSLYKWNGVDVAVRYNKADLMYIRRLQEKKSDYLRCEAEDFQGNGLATAVVSDGYKNWQACLDYHDSAYAKRKCALLMARCGYTYTFKNYVMLDGVSGLIYNTAYVCSVPRKLLTGVYAAEGVGEYLWNSVKLLIGGVFAIVGIPCSLVINTVCHPVETLANLTVGAAYFGQGWFTYVLNTNLLASLWDLIWGAIIYPLLSVFWFFM